MEVEVGGGRSVYPTWLDVVFVHIIVIEDVNMMMTGEPTLN